MTNNLTRMDRLFSTSSRDLVFVMAYVVVVTVVTTLAPTEEFLQWLEEILHRNPGPGLVSNALGNSYDDELVTLLIFLPVALAYFSWRRWKESSLEVTERKKAEEEVLELNRSGAGLPSRLSSST